MLKDITLGQFFPGNTLVHRLDPRAKLLCVILYIVALFTASGWLSYGRLLATRLIAIKISTIPPKSIVKGMKPLVMILIFTGLLNLFYTEGTPIWSFWIFTITYEGLTRAFFMILRISLLVTGTFMLTYTTSPVSLTDGMESLLRPLRHLHIPVHELSMMMCIALRFIPTLIEETDKIMSAQKARGADFESGNLLERAKSLIPILVPLFVSAFNIARDLAMAMEARCYRGGEHRTKMKPLVYKKQDYMAYLVLLVYFAACIVIGRLL